MALLSKHSGQSFDFAPAPEGDFQAVVVDVVDLGYLEKSFQGQSQGLKPHVQIVYQLGGQGEEGTPLQRPDGKPYFVFGRRQVLSMNERAGFYKEVCGIMGKKKVDEAVAGGTLDTEDLLGLNVNLTVAHHNGSNGTTYANIEALKPWNPRFGEPITAREYVRRHQRDNYIEPRYSSFGPPPPSEENDEETNPELIEGRAHFDVMMKTMFGGYPDHVAQRKAASPPKPTPNPTPSSSPNSTPVASPPSISSSLHSNPRPTNQPTTPRDYARALIEPTPTDEDDEDVFAD